MFQLVFSILWFMWSLDILLINTRLLSLNSSLILKSDITNTDQFDSPGGKLHWTDVQQRLGGIQLINYSPRVWLALRDLLDKEISKTNFSKICLVFWAGLLQPPPPPCTNPDVAEETDWQLCAKIIHLLGHCSSPVPRLYDTQTWQHNDDDDDDYWIYKVLYF